MQLFDVFEKVEKDMIKKGVWKPCPDYCEGCANCEIWEAWNKIKNDLLNEKLRENAKRQNR